MGVITYDLKRRILMAMTSIYCVTGVVLLYTTITLMVESKKKFREVFEAKDERGHSTAIFAAIQVVGLIIGTIAQIIGFVGAWREIVCLLVTYNVLLILTGITAVKATLENWLFSFILVVWLFLFLLTLTFILELRRKRRALNVEQTVCYDKSGN